MKDEIDWSLYTGNKLDYPSQMPKNARTLKSPPLIDFGYDVYEEFDKILATVNEAQRQGALEPTEAEPIPSDPQLLQAL